MPLPRPVDWSEIENDPQWNQLDPTQRRTVFANWQNHVRGFVDENGGFNDQTAATFHNDLAQITERNGLLEPEGPLTTAARKFASTILPDTATAAGGLGAGALAIESGPGAILADVAAGTAAHTAATYAQKKAVDATMGEGTYARNQAQMEANARENPTANTLGEMPGMLISMLGGGGGTAVKAGDKVIGKTLTPTGRRALETAAETKAAPYVAPLAERLATATELGARSGLAQGTAERVVDDKDVNPLDTMARSAVSMGVTGFMPHMDGLAKSVLVRAPADAALMTAGNAAYDAAVHNKAPDMQSMASEAAGSTPAFMMQNALLGLVPGLHPNAARLDTGQNIPESQKTLQLQQQQLIDGRRPAQMFTDATTELPLPEGMQRVENDRGIFHFNPKLVTADEVLSASRDGRENEILGYGSVSKPDALARAAKTGEPLVAVTERAPDGTEVKSAVGTIGTAATQAAQLDAIKTPGNTVAVEPLGQSLIERRRAQDKADTEARTAANAAEQARRDAAQAANNADKQRFNETLAAGDALAADPTATFPTINGVLNGLRKYTEDNSYALTQDQRNAALERIARLQPRADQLQLAHDAAAAQRVAAEQAAAKAAEQAKKQRIRAENARLDAIDATGRNPETGKIEDITKLTDTDLDQIGSDVASHGLTERQYIEELGRREREQAEQGNRAEFTLRDLFAGKRAALDAAGLDKPLRLPTPAAERARGGLGGELATLQEGTVPFSYFRNDAHPLDRLAEKLRGLGFKAETENDVLDLVGRAFNGEDVRPDTAGEVQFAAAARRAEQITRGISSEQLDARLTPTTLQAEAPTHAELEARLRTQAATQTSNLGMVGISGKRRNHLLHDARSPQDRRILASLADILKTARPLGEPEPDNTRRKNTTVSRALALVHDGNEAVPVVLTLHTDHMGTQLHSFSALTENKKALDQYKGEVSPGETHTIGSSAKAYTVRDFAPDVKSQPDGTHTAAFASTTEKPPGVAPLTDAELTQRVAALKTALGPIGREFDLHVGLIADAFAKEGYTRLAADLRAGNFGDDQGAVAPRLRHMVEELGGQRRFIVIAGEAAKQGKLPGLALHELGHGYYDGLPAETKQMLRDMWRHETTNRTGPLFDEQGEQKTDIAITADRLQADRLSTDPDLPIKEWFSERIRALNTDWLEGRMPMGERPLMARLWHQFMDGVQTIFAQVRGLTMGSDLFTDIFRNWFEAGAKDAAVREAASAYATRQGPKFATTQSTFEQAKAKRLTGVYFATGEKERDERAAALKGNPPEGVKTAADLEREQAALSDGARDARHPAAVGPTEPGEAWASVAKMTEPQLAEEQTKIGQHLNDYALDLADIEKANLESRATALKAEQTRRIIAAAPRVTALPKVDRATALKTELARGRALRDEGNRTGNDTAVNEGVRIVKAATERLDAEFPNWESPRTPKRAQDSRTAQDDGRNLPPPVPPEPPENGPARPDDAAPDRGRAAAAFGHSSASPAWYEKSWARLRAGLVGFRGPLPELPTFPELAAKSDRFIREKGPAFYNPLKAFYRTLHSGNDYVQRTAEEQVAAITSPLLKAGGEFNANDYALLKRRQEQVRRLQSESKPVPPGVDAEIKALNSRLETSPYVLLNKLVYFMDMDWRGKNLKDSAGNPIKLPGGLNSTEIETELNRLGAGIEANPHKAAIEKAFAQHMDLVKRTADDLKGRDLFAAEALTNPYYFPHLTLETKNAAGETIQRELKPERVRVGTEADFRGYLQDPIGSLKPIESDYVRGMYYHLVQLGAHNLKADAIKDYARPYDVKAQVEARAQQLSKERGKTVSWEQVFHEEYAPNGYTLYGTDSRDAFPTVMVDRDKLARRLGKALTSADLHEQLRQLGVKGVKLLPEDLKESLVQGARETWVVPDRVAEALRGIADRQQTTSEPIGAAIKQFNGAWKAWKLFMPQNHVRYEYGNVVADLEKLFSASPRTFKYLGQSAKEMRAFFQGEAPGNDLRAALKDGVINAITAQEMDQLTHTRAFEKFQTSGERIKTELTKRGSSALYQPITNLLGLGKLSSVELSALREGVTRYAKFLGDLDAIRHGARPDYAGAYWKDIEAIGDSRPGANDKAYRQAAQISKSTFGDYGDISVGGQYIRQKIIPFYSWMEVNFKYHANLLRNLRDMVKQGQIGQGQATGQAAKALATLAAGSTARVAGGVVLRLALPYVAVAMWNNSGDRNDLEKLLSEEDRRRFHIILGESKSGNSTIRDGRKVEVIYGNTAFADVTKWFSGPKFVQSMAGWIGGKTDFPTAVGSWAQDIGPDLVNNTIGSSGPIPKLAVAAIYKKTTFPDVLDAKTIPSYDMRRNIIGQMTDDFTADMIERAVNKDYYSSKDVGDWTRQLILQVRQRDPESWAFADIRNKAASWQEDRTGTPRDSSFDAPDKQVLRNFRRAIYKGDPEAAAQFYQRLLDYGYTAERFAESIKSQEPLAMLPKEVRMQFVQSLDANDRDELKRAYAYYVRITGAKGVEKGLFAPKEYGDAGAKYYAAHPHMEILRKAMEAPGQLDENQLKQRANYELINSLIPR